MKTLKTKGRPDALYRVIGERLHQRRKDLGLSQRAVADSIGITYQQIQKYEAGQNRIAASTLYHLSCELDTRNNPVGLGGYVIHWG